MTWSSKGVIINRLLPGSTSGSSKELELPADSELTKDPGLIGELPELIDFPAPAMKIFRERVDFSKFLIFFREFINDR